MATDRKPLFKASNHHVADSGEPPFFDADTAGKYFGYFQNEYGEQLVFVYDYAEKRASSIMAMLAGTILCQSSMETRPGWYSTSLSSSGSGPAGKR